MDNINGFSIEVNEAVNFALEDSTSIDKRISRLTIIFTKCIANLENKEIKDKDPSLHSLHLVVEMIVQLTAEKISPQNPNVIGKHVWKVFEKGLDGESIDKGNSDYDDLKKQIHLYGQKIKEKMETDGIVPNSIEYQKMRQKHKQSFLRDETFEAYQEVTNLSEAIQTFQDSPLLTNNGDPASEKLRSAAHDLKGALEGCKNDIRRVFNIHYVNACNSSDKAKLEQLKKGQRKIKKFRTALANTEGDMVQEHMKDYLRLIQELHQISVEILNQNQQDNKKALDKSHQDWLQEPSRLMTLQDSIKTFTEKLQEKRGPQDAQMVNDDDKRHAGQLGMPENSYMELWGSVCKDLEEYSNEDQTVEEHLQVVHSALDEVLPQLFSSYLDYKNYVFDQAKVVDIQDSIREQIKVKLADYPGMPIEGLKHLLETTIKTTIQAARISAAVKDNQAFKEVGRGAEKQVLIHSDIKEHVFMVPVGYSQAGIEAEIQTIDALRQAIWQNHLKQFLLNYLPDDFDERQRDGVIEHFATPGDLLEKVLAQDVPSLAKTLDISEDFAQQLRQGVIAKAQLLANFWEEISLAVDMQIVPKENAQDGSITLLASRAEGDLEKQLQKGITQKQAIKFGFQLIAALSDLHAAGYMHGDIKSGNILVYANENVKLADFGRTKPIPADNKPLPLVGNPRMAAPEGEITTKSEVYSLAIMLISLFENKFLKDHKLAMLADIPAHLTSKASFSDKRQGIEGYLCKHPDCTQIDNKTMCGSIIRLYRLKNPGNLIGTIEEARLAENAIYLYIDAMQEAYKGDTKILKLCTVLRNMTQSDVTQRPSMQEVLEEYQDIFDLIA